MLALGWGRGKVGVQLEDINSELPCASTFKQKDDSHLVFFHFCKQRKEKKEIPGGVQADTGEDSPPAWPHGLALTKIHRGPSFTMHQGPQGTPGVTESQGSHPLASSQLGGQTRSSPVLGHVCLRAMCWGVRGGLGTR